jgi:hypothetical protein
MASTFASKLREKPRQRLSTEYIASLVGMAFPRAATMETAMNALRNRGLWPVGRSVFTADDFAPYRFTGRPGTIQLQKPTAEWMKISASFLHMKLR